MTNNWCTDVKGTSVICHVLFVMLCFILCCFMTWWWQPWLSKRRPKNLASIKSRSVNLCKMEVVYLNKLVGFLSLRRWASYGFRPPTQDTTLTPTTQTLTLGSPAKYSINVEGTSAKSVGHLVPVTCWYLVLPMTECRAWPNSWNRLSTMLGVRHGGVLPKPTPEEPRVSPPTILPGGNDRRRTTIGTW